MYTCVYMQACMGKAMCGCGKCQSLKKIVLHKHEDILNN